MWVFWPSIENNDRYPYPEWEVEMATRGRQNFVHTPEEAERLVAERQLWVLTGSKRMV